MTTAELMDAIPILDVRDVERALRFYVDRLGFAVEFRNEEHPDNYAGVRRGGVSIHMQWQHEDAFRDRTAGPLRLRILVDDPDALFAEYDATGATSEITVRDSAWGTREFALRDPDGNGLIFYRDRKPDSGLNETE